MVSTCLRERTGRDVYLPTPVFAQGTGVPESTLWLVKTGNLLIDWQFPAGSCPHGEFSVDGESIAIAGVGIASVIHAHHAEELRPLPISILRSRACQR